MFSYETHNSFGLDPLWRWFINSYPFEVGMRSDATNVPCSCATVWSEHCCSAAGTHHKLSFTFVLAQDTAVESNSSYLPDSLCPVIGTFRIEFKLLLSMYLQQRFGHKFFVFIFVCSYQECTSVFVIMTFPVEVKYRGKERNPAAQENWLGC